MTWCLRCLHVFENWLKGQFAENISTVNEWVSHSSKPSLHWARQDEGEDGETEEEASGS